MYAAFYIVEIFLQDSSDIIRYSCDLLEQNSVNCIIECCAYNRIFDEVLQNRGYAFCYNIKINLARLNISNVNISKESFRLINLISYLPL